ncbi:MAG TPA: response regulator transcription factor [Jatrophihabitans sp.]|uniref:response regulator n=1 Tax=Jatrophihabitans sp. TaxID=1932789 RepID=UPI002E04F218|nr:response regulator transcription factor [Jatrophihabitans sp.]
MPLRVLIADDDDEVRSALVLMIGSDEQFEVVADVASAPAAVEAVRCGPIDIAVLDLNMPGRGVEAAREIAAISPRTTLIVVSARIDSTTASTLVRAGVRGIFVKGQLDADLPETIAACHAGEVRLAVPVAADALRAVRPR